MGEVVAIWIKRAHGGPMDCADKAQLVAGRGVVNSADQGGWRQITLIEESAWHDAERELGAEVDPSTRRANVMIRGVDLENSRGRQLRMGNCLINVRGENPACGVIGEGHPGLVAALRPHWRSGVFAEIVEGGAIRVGDAVAWHGSGTG